jgi:UrcA family protein
MKRAILCAALGATALLGAVTVAQAEDGQMRVPLAGVNLDTEAGAKTALTRIENSADRFCDGNAGRQTLERSQISDRCAASMTRKGVTTLDAPLVTARLDRQTGVSTSQYAALSGR